MLIGMRKGNRFEINNRELEVEGLALGKALRQGFVRIGGQ